MALKSPFLANEPLAVRRSRALHRFTVASPLVLLMAVGMVGHVGRLGYARPTSARDYERKVRAYVPRVAGVRALQDEAARSRKAVDAEADRWLSGYRSGELQTLKPAYYEDHLQNGPRGEVMRAALSLSNMLVYQAARELDDDHAGRAAETALRAAKIGAGVREFETQSLLQALINQRRAIFVLGRAWPRLSETQRARLRPELRAMRTDPVAGDRLRAEADALYDEYRIRQKIDEPPLPTGVSERREGGALVRSTRISNERLDALLR